MRTSHLFLSLLLLGCPADDDEPADDQGAGDTQGTSTTASDGTDEGSSAAPDPESSSGTADDGDATSGASTTSPLDDGESSSGMQSTDESGNDVSPECMQYCDEFIPNCSPIPNVEVYDDLDDCLQTCAPWAHGPVGEFSGDTVECRIAHLTFEPDPGPGYYELHCFHAQEHPTSQCV